MKEVGINSQFKKGVLELCVLEMVRRKDRYGYELAREVSEEIDISEGVLYPILRRLSKDKNFETYLKESDGGPSRKYYRITELGLKRLEILRKEWLNFIQKVGRITNHEEK